MAKEVDISVRLRVCEQNNNNNNVAHSSAQSRNRGQREALACCVARAGLQANTFGQVKPPLLLLLL